MASLQGRTVIVTRPADQSDGLVLALEQAGARPLAFPTLTIEPVEISAADRQKILDLDQYRIVFCVSPNAARLGLDALSDYWPQWPVQQLWLAVGPATGAAMEGWGLNLLTGSQGATSETLLDLPELKMVAGERVLILRGEGGRDHMANTLRERGARVDFLELYRRGLPAADPSPLWAALQSPEPPILTVTSGDALRNLMIMAEKHLNRLKQCPLIVISGRLAEFARQQGFSRVWLAASPATSDIMDTLHNNQNN